MRSDWPTTKEGWPIVFLHPAIYAAAEREGCDMRQFVRTEPIPTIEARRLQWTPEELTALARPNAPAIFTVRDERASNATHFSPSLDALMMGFDRPSGKPLTIYDGGRVVAVLYPGESAEFSISEPKPCKPETWVCDKTLPLYTQTES
jgi:hypothetical protein